MKNNESDEMVVTPEMIVMAEKLAGSEFKKEKLEKFYIDDGWLKINTHDTEYKALELSVGTVIPSGRARTIKKLILLYSKFQEVIEKDYANKKSASLVSED